MKNITAASAKAVRIITDVLNVFAWFGLAIAGCLESQSAFEECLLWICALYVVMWTLANMDRLQGEEGEPWM